MNLPQLRIAAGTGQTPPIRLLAKKPMSSLSRKFSIDFKITYYLRSESFEEILNPAIIIIDSTKLIEQVPVENCFDIGRLNTFA
jgi:hypothetical protein